MKSKKYKVPTPKKNERYVIILGTEYTEEEYYKFIDIFEKCWNTGVPIFIRGDVKLRVIRKPNIIRKTKK